MSKLQTPKFLTETSIVNAINLALSILETESFKSLFPNFDKECNCHIVVLVPAIEDDRELNYPKWPNYPLRPHAIYEASFGVKEKWRHRFNDIAQCKALQLWGDRNDGGTSVMPHLLFSGDTPWWGGVKREGIVVSCSGFNCEIDRLIAGMVADIVITQAYNAFIRSPEHTGGKDFLE